MGAMIRIADLSRPLIYISMLPYGVWLFRSGSCITKNTQTLFRLSPPGTFFPVNSQFTHQFVLVFLIYRSIEVPPEYINTDDYAGYMSFELPLQGFQAASEQSRTWSQHPEQNLIGPGHFAHHRN